jgi:hypothetical protein
MRVRKLTVTSLEDRRVPSAVLVDSARATDVRANEAIVFVPSPAATLALGGSAVTSPDGPNGKLATNHNETLVRDRRRTKNRGR